MGSCLAHVGHLFELVWPVQTDLWEVSGVLLGVICRFFGWVFVADRGGQFLLILVDFQAPEEIVRLLPKQLVDETRRLFCAGTTDCTLHFTRLRGLSASR